jgi:hypothetical protein
MIQRTSWIVHPRARMVNPRLVAGQGLLPMMHLINVIEQRRRCFRLNAWRVWTVIGNSYGSGPSSSTRRNHNLRLNVGTTQVSGSNRAKTSCLLPWSSRLEVTPSIRARFMPAVAL